MYGQINWGLGLEVHAEGGESTRNQGKSEGVKGWNGKKGGRRGDALYGGLFGLKQKEFSILSGGGVHPGGERSGTGGKSSSTNEETQ